MISQGLFYYALYFFEVFNLNNSLFIFYIIISIVISTFIEAYSKDNDNLILSICVYPVLVCIH
jgi:hypothetical protein